MYDELMELWKDGDIGPIALYLNKRGIYSSMNGRKDKLGSYTWVNPKIGVMQQDLLVLGVMFFPSELRYSNRGDSK